MCEACDNSEACVRPVNPKSVAEPMFFSNNEEQHYPSSQNGGFEDSGEGPLDVKPREDDRHGSDDGWQEVEPLPHEPTYEAWKAKHPDAASPAAPAAPRKPWWRNVQPAINRGLQNMQPAVNKGVGMAKNLGETAGRAWNNFRGRAKSKALAFSDNDIVTADYRGHFFKRAQSDTVWAWTL